ncbi:MAG: hypothetical protein ACR2HP_11600 [Ilumatobacteraceae bacterium]
MHDHGQRGRGGDEPDGDGHLVAGVDEPGEEEADAADDQQQTSPVARATVDGDESATDVEQPE